MENQNIQENPTPTPPVTGAVQTPQTPTVEKPKPKFPFAAIIGIILFLLVAGGAAASFTVLRPQIMKLVSKPTPSPTITLQVSPTPTPNATSSWKTYNDDYFGFTIKYPQDFVASPIREETRHILTSGKDAKIKTVEYNLPNGTIFTMHLEDNDNFKTSEDYQKFFIKSYNQEQMKKVNIDGTSATVATKQLEGYGREPVPSNPPPLPIASIAFFAKNEKTYDISISSPFQVGSQEKLLTDILSTFKFTDNSSTSNDIPKEIGDFPIYPGANFVQTKAKSDCGENQAPPDSNCYNIQYIFSTNDAFQKVYAFDINKTDTGWICSGGAGEIDAPTPTTGSTTTSCKKGDKNYFYTRSGNTQGSQIIIGIPAN